LRQVAEQNERILFHGSKVYFNDTRIIIISQLI